MKELIVSLSRKDIRNSNNLYQVIPSGEHLQEITDVLSQTVYGQDRAVRDTARAMLRSSAGFSDPNKPEFSALFLGPPGTGKTEMGKAISRYLNPKEPEKNLLVVDCADYQQSHDIHRITGSPNSYVGYGDKPIITSEHLVNKNVIVFDEIEKAHPALHRVLLGILDRGKLQVPIGTSTYQNVKMTELNFAKSSILLTSNIGSSEMQAQRMGRGQMGFHTENGHNDNIYDIGLKAAREYFKSMPELLNRLDCLVVFDDLTPPVFRKILDKFIDQYNNFQRFPNYLALTSELKDYLIEKTDKRYGGRELKREFEKKVLVPASEVKFQLKPNQPFIADLSDEEQVIFWAVKIQEQPVEAVTDLAVVNVG